MTIKAKVIPQPDQEIVVYSEKPYRRGDTEPVTDEAGRILGHAECVGNFGRNPKFIHTDQNGKKYPYGRHYHKFIFKEK